MHKYHTSGFNRVDVRTQKQLPSYFPLQHELQIKKSEIAQTFELVEIPIECKGFVIGRGGENLRQISSQTGADLIRKDGNVYLASGTEEQRQHAKQHIREIVVSCKHQALMDLFGLCFSFPIEFLMFS